MSQDVIFQGQLFGMAIIWGGGLLLAYDGLRLLRLFVTHRRGVQAVEEVIFWLAASFIIYTLIYRYNSGSVRNYVVFGMAVGMVIYRLCLSSWVIRMSCLILRPVRNGIRFIKTFLKDYGKRLKFRLIRVKIKLKVGKKETGDGNGSKRAQGVRRKGKGIKA